MTEEERYFLILELEYELAKEEEEKYILNMNKFNEEMNTLNEEYVINELNNKDLSLYY